MRIASAAYAPDWHPDWDSLAAKLTGWVTEAADAGADLLVFPEYAGIEAVLIGAPQADPGAIHWRDAMAAAVPAYHALMGDLARSRGVHILSGSLNAATGAGYVNRAALHTPDGATGVQDKLIPTPYERQVMGLSGGAGPQLFDTALGRIGILICYDSEFPLLARAMVAGGADMILVPSCTELQAGQTRVRQSCRARAIEGQCLIVQAPLLGAVAECDIVNRNTGRAGIFAPPDYGLPDTGVIAQGETDRVGWVLADVDPVQIATPRSAGQVGNFTHWPEQTPHMDVPLPTDLR